MSVVVIMNIKNWGLAQLVEHFSYTEAVPGSNPGVPTSDLCVIITKDEPTLTPKPDPLNHDRIALQGLDL